MDRDPWTRGFRIDAPERVPALRDPARWESTLRDAYEARCSTEHDVLDEYATTNHAEFVAVASEVFFEQPTALRAAYPAFYQQLTELYRQDPAARADVSNDGDEIPGRGLDGRPATTRST